MLKILSNFNNYSKNIPDKINRAVPITDQRWMIVIDRSKLK